ncbi:hypothetical protein NQZ68_000078 [Dissostichus eleginoides]|nr:hypothetical protein NQZ68_000078 [Dissostichus eleginoides]
MVLLYRELMEPDEKGRRRAPPVARVLSQENSSEELASRDRDAPLTHRGAMWGLELACHPALVPWIRDQWAQGTKTHCLHKMLSIINAVYRAIRGIAETKGGNKEMGSEGREQRHVRQIKVLVMGDQPLHSKMGRTAGVGADWFVIYSLPGSLPSTQPQKTVFTSPAELVPFTQPSDQYQAGSVSVVAVALDKKCKERQHDSLREEPAYSIEKQPTEFSLLSPLHLWCCQFIFCWRSSCTRTNSDAHIDMHAWHTHNEQDELPPSLLSNPNGDTTKLREQNHSKLTNKAKSDSRILRAAPQFDRSFSRGASANALHSSTSVSPGQIAQQVKCTGFVIRPLVAGHFGIGTKLRTEFLSGGIRSSSSVGVKLRDRILMGEMSEG